MKAFFSKLWSWIVSHKVVSIIIASVLVVGITCAIVLPIALKHDDSDKHDSFETAWVFSCQKEEEHTINIVEGQKLYIKLMSAEGTMCDFYFKTTTGSNATYTYEIFDSANTTTPSDSQTTAGQHVIYADVCSTGCDVYVVITCVTGGEVSISISK